MFALFIPALMGALATAMGSFIGRAILALGIGFVTYKGIDLSIGAIKAGVLSGVRGLPVDALNLVGYLYLDKAITVVMSSFVVAFAMRTASGSVKRMELK
jgi:Protein of unknown function (DUF2523)